MRFVVVGAGAIGGVIGGRLSQHGQPVVLIARGSHGAAIRERGLRIDSPGGPCVVNIPTVAHPARLRFGDDDVIVLAVKSQHTAHALDQLAGAAPPSTPIVCAQNGVANESAANRRFAAVYGMAVMCPASYLQPGIVAAYAWPTTGILDLGRWPRGTDEVTNDISAALRASGFVSAPITDIRARKYGKLLMNLENAVEAVCGPAARGGPVGRRARAEAELCLRVAGIAADIDDDPQRITLVTPHPIDGAAHPGSSSWQSLQRRTGDIETDYLNGEIVRLGRQFDVPTPVNELLTRLATDAATHRTPPGAVPEDQLLAQAGG